MFAECNYSKKLWINKAFSAIRDFGLSQILGSFFTKNFGGLTSKNWAPEVSPRKVFSSIRDFGK